jgi:hypothetical protein
MRLIKGQGRRIQRFQFEIYAECLAEHGNVLGSREPWRKIGSLADPDIPEVNPFEATLCRACFSGRGWDALFPPPFWQSPF